jgi:hypothetical protein
MTRKTNGYADAPDLQHEGADDGSDYEIRSVVGFASAICYLAYEAERAGWSETLEYLEEAYSAFLDEVGADRVRFRVYSNPERQ